MKKDDQKVANELKNINLFYDLQEKLALVFSVKLQRQISSEDIFYALYMTMADIKKLDYPGDLWDKIIEMEEAIDFLNDFDFDILHIKINIVNDIFPDDFFISEKVRIKSKNSIWVIHKNDKDPFPSNPHAHLLNTNIKLDLSTGKCYRFRKHEYSIRRKELLVIRDKARNVFKGELPDLVTDL